MDLAVSEAYYRYIYTLPTEDREPGRLMVHMHQAYGFYMEELRVKFGLPEVKFSAFLQTMQDRFMLLEDYTVKELIDLYDWYRSRIPVKGAVLMNSSLDRILLLYSEAHRRFNFP